MSANSIEVKGLSRTFHTTVRRPGLVGGLRSLVNPERVPKHAVSDVTFDVAPGELLALLGPNGAGKSTTIKILTGILRPTSGEARVAGVVPYEERERNARNIGAVFGQRTQLWWDLPVRESFAILRDIYEVPKAQHAARLREFDDLLELSAFWDTRVRHLSLGQRVRCDLAAALLHDPPVVFLDEPTIGMDVVVKEQVREFLRHQVEERGRTVLLTTHDMTEVAKLAERVALIDQGRLMYDGKTAGLHDLAGVTWQVHVTVDGIPAATDVAGMRMTRAEGERLTFVPDQSGGLSPRDAVRRLIEHLPVTDIRVEEPDLEDVVRAAFARRDTAPPGDAPDPDGPSPPRELGAGG